MSNPGLDALRGIAALMVVLFHQWQHGFAVLPGRFVQLGHLGVGLFFTLSGFLIARSVMTPDVFDVRRYCHHRAVRILPNYFVCLLLVLAFIDARPLIGASPWGSVGNFVSHLFLVHAWFDRWSMSILVVLWTLSHEWTFYALMLAVARPLRAKHWWLVPAGMMACKWSLLLATRNGWLDSSSLGGAYTIIQYWDQFAYGILAAGLPLRTGLGRWLASPAVALTVTMVGLCLIIGEYVREVKIAEVVEHMQGDRPGVASKVKFAEQFVKLFAKSKSNVLWWPVALGVGRGLVLMGVHHGPRWLTSWLHWSPLPWMGKVSYSTYLYHLLVIFCLERAFKGVAKDSCWTSPALQFTVLFAAIYIVSWVMYVHIESPWMQRARREPKNVATPQ